MATASGQSDKKTSYQAVELPSCCTVKLLSCQVAVLSSCELPSCCAAKLLSCQAAELSSFLGVKLLNC